MPVDAAVAFAHAEVQAIAEDFGVDLLHIKGPALTESLRRPWPDDVTGTYRRSNDADVLVRPSHVRRFTAALNASGWRCLYDFADGSAFEHAATWARDDLSSVDVHRYFPGIEADPATAFDILWAAKESWQIAGIHCPVPDLTAQRLILLIHAARGRSRRDQADRERAWFSLDDDGRSDVDDLADRLGARVALRAGTGRLETVRGERTYPLWRYLTSGETSLPALWVARVRSAPTLRASARIGVRMLIPNRQRMTTQLGRAPSGREVVDAYRARFGLGVASLQRWARARLRRPL